jgi:ubiquitin carboxyl-terminal hydrolase L3
MVMFMKLLVMTSYAARLGLDTNILQFHDVMSTEDWALEMIPRPVVGVLMLYPIKETTEGHREAEDIRIKQEGQICSDKVYYMKQTVGNACGTVGVSFNVRVYRLLPLLAKRY